MPHKHWCLVHCYELCHQIIDICGNGQPPQSLPVGESCSMFRKVRCVANEATRTEELPKQLPTPGSMPHPVHKQDPAFFRPAWPRTHITKAPIEAWFSLLPSRYF